MNSGAKHMNRLQLSTALFAAVVGFVAVAPKAAADEWDKKTIITTNETIEVPGATLPPGTYVFKLLDTTDANRHTVIIQNERENHTYATILAIPNYRIRPTGTSRFMFWETPAGQPKALRAWFYPGDNFGQEFAYKKHRAVEIAQNTTTHEEVPQQAEETATVSQTQTDTSSNDNTQVAQVAPAPAPAPAPVADNTPAPAPEPAPAPAVVAQNNTPRELPQTASNYPTLALIGFASLGFALMLGVLVRKLS
jgi:LPXTG-motif cell wall-anchored protein